MKVVVVHDRYARHVQVIVVNCLGRKESGWALRRPSSDTRDPSHRRSHGRGVPSPICKHETLTPT